MNDYTKMKQIILQHNINVFKYDDYDNYGNTMGKSIYLKDPAGYLSFDTDKNKYYYTEAPTNDTLRFAFAGKRLIYEIKILQSFYFSFEDINSIDEFEEFLETRKDEQ